MEEKYIVFQKYASNAEWEQESVRLTLERAKAFLKERESSKPDNFYCIMMEIEDS